MTTITTTCTGCGRQLAVPERYRGRDLKCPSCGRPFRLEPPEPAPPAETVPPASAEVFPEPAAATQAPAAVPFGEPPAAAPQPAPEPEPGPEGVPVEAGAVFWRVQRIGVLSLALLSAVLHGALGLLVGIAVAIAASSPAGRAIPFLNGPVLGVLAVLVLPFVYGAVGFVAGALTAAVYNFGARLLGGVRILLE